MARCRSPLLAVAALAVGMLAASRAHADDCNGDSSDKTVLSIAFGLERTSFVAHLASTHFSSGFGQSDDGSAFGVYAPRVHTYGGVIELGLGAFYGAFHFGGGSSGADVAPRDPALAARVSTGSLLVAQMGAEIGAHAWLFGHLDLRLGGILGGRFYSMNLLDAPPHAAESAAQGWIEPRLSALVFVGDHTGVAIGGFVGTQLLEPRDIETGLSISFMYKGLDPP